jgi:hypothetical protein
VCHQSNVDRLLYPLRRKPSEGLPSKSGHPTPQHPPPRCHACSRKVPSSERARTCQSQGRPTDKGKLLQIGSLSRVCPFRPFFTKPVDTDPTSKTVDSDRIVDRASSNHSTRRRALCFLLIYRCSWRHPLLPSRAPQALLRSASTPTRPTLTPLRCLWPPSSWCWRRRSSLLISLCRLPLSCSVPKAYRGPSTSVQHSSTGRLAFGFAILSHRVVVFHIVLHYLVYG